MDTINLKKLGLSALKEKEKNYLLKLDEKEKKDKLIESIKKTKEKIKGKSFLKQLWDSIINREEF